MTLQRYTVIDYKLLKVPQVVLASNTGAFRDLSYSYVFYDVMLTSRIHTYYLTNLRVQRINISYKSFDPEIDIDFQWTAQLATQKHH